MIYTVRLLNVMESRMNRVAADILYYENNRESCPVDFNYLIRERRIYTDLWLIANTGETRRACPIDVLGF